MADIRNFKKQRTIKSDDVGITEGVKIDDIPTKPTLVHDTNNIEGEHLPTRNTVMPDNSATEMTNIEDERDTIDLYYDFIKEQGITDDVIRSTQIQLLENKTIVFEAVILNKFKIGFSPRPSWANDKIIEESSRHTDNLSLANYNNIIAKVNMACSLEFIEGYNLPSISRDNYEERMRIIGDLPSFLYDKIVQELIVFDRLIAVATSDKYLETFI